MASPPQGETLALEVGLAGGVTKASPAQQLEMEGLGGPEARRGAPQEGTWGRDIQRAPVGIAPRMMFLENRIQLLFGAPHLNSKNLKPKGPF